MNVLLSIISANILISLISLVSIVAISFKALRRKSTTILFVSFAAGVLLATSLLNVLPEALEGLDLHEGLRLFMYGVIGAFLFERLLVWHHHHHDDTHNIKPTALLVLIGDGIHNFIDGLAIAASFLINPALGVTTLLAIASHEIPQEIADYSILRHCGMSRKKALTWNFVSALTAILGGVVGYYVFQESTELVYYALAITAGIFLYVSAADLIPELHHEKSAHHIVRQTLLFLSGVLLMVWISGLVPHGHGDESEYHEDEGVVQQHETNILYEDVMDQE